MGLLHGSVSVVVGLMDCSFNIGVSLSDLEVRGVVRFTTSAKGFCRLDGVTSGSGVRRTFFPMPIKAFSKE